MNKTEKIEANRMHLLTLDFESYYDSKSFTLKKMTTEAYIRDQRFEALGLGVYDVNEDCLYYSEKPTIKETLSTYDWDNTGVIAHHAHFDGLILSHHYGIHPKYWFDTISMARYVLGSTQACSLGSLAKLFELPDKSVPYNLFDSKRFHQLDSKTRELMAEGCIHDCELTYQIFKILLPRVPEHELKIADRVIRMFTEPKLQGDVQLLTHISQQEADAKAKALEELQIEAKELQSSAKFSALLEEEGVEIEYKDGKPSKKTGEVKQIPCFAKTDEFMQGLLVHDNPRVAALAEARLGAKSTLNETRAGRLLSMAERGPLCVYYYMPGTHTLRTAGGDATNFGNLPRKGDLRKCVKAPQGRKLGIFDLRQIELRTGLYTAKDLVHLDDLVQGGNLYVDMAELVFDKPIDKEQDEDEYKAGKELVLGAQYGCGWFKFLNVCKGKGIVLPFLPFSVLCNSEISDKPLNNYLNDREKKGIGDEGNMPFLSIYRYRQTYKRTCALWSEGKEVIERLYLGESFDWRCFEIKDKKLYAPNGSCMNFNISKDDNGDWKNTTGRNKSEKIHGAKFFENANQFLARCVFWDRATIVSKEYDIVMTAYDDGLFVMDTEEDLQIAKKIMETTPDWLPGLPLEVEAKLAGGYEK